VSDSRFHHADGVYILDQPDRQVTLTLNRVERTRDGLTGFLSVSTSLTFVRATHGVVRHGKINLHAPTTVAQWAKQLADAFNTDVDDLTLPWATWLHELSVRVTKALAAGPPPVNLSEGAPPPPVSVTVLPAGVVVLNRLPMLIAADGEVGKSTLALWMAGHLTAHGHRVLYADWEQDEDIAKQTLWRLFAPEVPPVHYYAAKPYGAIWDQQEGLQAQIKTLGITYLICDSVVPATQGGDGPESAGLAARYYGTVASLGPLGSLHLAHVTKASREDDKKAARATAFGSAFWQNLARIAYFADSDDEGLTSTRTVALYRTKGGTLAKARVHDTALDFAYDDTVADGTGRIDVTPGNLLDNPVLAQRVGFARRVTAFLHRSTATTPEIAEHLYGDAEEAQLGKARGVLAKLVKQGRVVNIDAGTGRGHTGRWALTTNRNAEA